MYVGLEQIALRNSSLYVPRVHPQATMSDASAEFVANLSNIYSVSEPLLHALNGASAHELTEIRQAVAHIFRTDANWTPLVRDWHTPTGESGIDHLITFWANLFDRADMPGVRLACGHFIPDVAFDIERYNGCPFCGRPLVYEPGALRSEATPRKVLNLMTDADMTALRDRLLVATIPPDATTADTLRTLLGHFGVPDAVKPATREALLLTAEALDKAGRTAAAYALLTNPDDLLRYLWYRATGSLAFRSPRTYRGKDLRLHFSRPEGRAIAQCLEAMNISAERMAEIMHPRREMWVHVIRAARLAEFARSNAFPRLRRLLDVFYRGEYEVFAARVQRCYDTRDARGVSLLETRPGLFARSLFSWMLRVGPADPAIAFASTARNMAGRLLYSLFAAADFYFMPDGDTRTVAPGHGLQPAVIDVNPGIKDYTDSERADMVLAIKDIFMNEMRRRYAAAATDGGSVYIAPELFYVPMPVGDRSTTVSDIKGAALPGQRFKVEGDRVRLFLQWGVGLPAQPLDMDLSAAIIYADSVDECAYYSLSVNGARHSGDIREIPDLVGTAEYIELDLPTLADAGAKMVVFTCNAYSVRELSPNLVFGWMSADAPMALDEKTGVAYDPADVQQMMRVPDNNTARGIMFGVLDVAAREITWLDMPFNGRTLRNLSLGAVSGILRRLRTKPSIGEMLALRAEAIGATRVDDASEATEAYDIDLAGRPEAVAELLLPPTIENKTD